MKSPHTELLFSGKYFKFINEQLHVYRFNQSDGQLLCLNQKRQIVCHFDIVGTQGSQFYAETISFGYASTIHFFDMAMAREVLWNNERQSFPL